MQEIRHDGTQKLTEAATPEQVMKAVANPKNRRVNIFLPGTMVRDAAGNHYVVQHGGKLRPERPGEREEPFHAGHEIPVVDLTMYTED